ncbi:MAG TPA: formyltransferase family protein [Mucilaginibacter sp.]|nr:formyltransferase family protein [Mucilaginibacter sp.]
MTFEADKNELYNWQQVCQPDIIFFSGYNHIIETDRLSDVKHGLYNIHFGPLPQFRGPSPVFWQLRTGQKEVGLVIHKMTQKLDQGAVVWEQKITNQPYFNYEFLNRVFGEQQCKGVIAVLDLLNAGKQPIEKIQDENNAAYYNLPQLKDVIIDWENMEAEEILDLIKACNPWNFGATTILNGAEVRILDAVIKTGNNGSHQPGKVLNVGDEMLVACRNNKSIAIFFFRINGSFAPARYARNFGIGAGQFFKTVTLQ